MQSDSSTLPESAPFLRPLAFPRGQVARNSLWLAPLTNLQSEADGTLSDVEERWLLRRAEGGFGVIETCAAYVQQSGKTWPGQLGVDRDECLPRLRSLASGLRQRGALSIVQLFHGGARASRALAGDLVSATAHAVGDDHARAATDEDLIGTIDSFRAAALRVAAAGFDGVEIHGAHGYLPAQFLSRTNQRDDRWGGSLENRARLLRTLVQEVRRALPDHLVGVRLSPEDYGTVAGIDLDETATVAGWLAADGVDFVHASLWDHRQPSKKYPDEAPFQRIRAAVPLAIPVVAAGAFWTPAEASRWMHWAEALPAADGSGGAVAVALGSAAIVNPDWPAHAAQPGWEPTRLPVSAEHLAAVAVGAPFIDYLRRRRGFVADPA
ncbi:MAG: NADH:flavin oxidoreductase [Deltaproteobacteria bacterium]|nr:NADH:flavin oxidoreductase [Deltaproteobacteria bacterium]